MSIKFILKALYHKQSTIFPISKKLRGRQDHSIFFISIVVLIQLIFYLSSVLLVCLQNQVNGDETKQFCFKSKAFIDRNIFSCYQG